MFLCYSFILLSVVSGLTAYLIPGQDGPQPYLNAPLEVEEIEEQGWQMVFRATAGNGEDVYNAFTKGTSVTTQKPIDMARSLDSHYRDPRIDHWSNLNVQYVKIGLYKQSREVGYIVFDGLNSNLTTWFDAARVEASSWSDLTKTHAFNIFSIAGHIDSGLERTFFINVQYGGCDNDMGHLVIVERDGGCGWDHEPTYPTILYSDMNHADFWNRREFGRADYMAVFIYTERPASVVG